ncbi:3-deoxy-D-manno-octulosonate 8-phosphate phosphatase [Burkholderiales bacterium]|nr:3-deoxy-D-manno-octulosonate 8-phosphate phosphatase [Burkholderiales bacterium]
MARMTGSALVRRAARVRLVGLDVDGVLTDGRLYFGARGEALKAFDVRDGLGIRLLRDAGIDVAVVTGRSSRIVAARARDLGIDKVMQGQRDKRACLQRLLAQAGVSEGECAYMGDDWPDLPVLTAVGLAATVADAPEEVKRRVHWVAPSPGGRGAVRDLARLVLRAQGRFDALLQSALQPAASELAHG